MIREKLGRGAAVLGIFHDESVRDRVATRVVDVSSFSAGGRRAVIDTRQTLEREPVNGLEGAAP